MNEQEEISALRDLVRKQQEQIAQLLQEREALLREQCEANAPNPNDEPKAA